jgi:hypothetical protein
MGPSEPTTADSQPRTAPSWWVLRLAALCIILLALLFVLGLRLWSDGAAYPRLDHDHDELMVSRTAKPGSTVTILFIGNSLTFRNDLPAMLVDLASSDPGNTMRLQVKGETYPDAWLDDLYAKGHALDWARNHHVDEVVLQEHSLWYRSNYEGARAAASRWMSALRTLNAAPLLFEVWADGEGSDVYTDKDYAGFGLTPAEDARNAADATDTLGRSLGLPVVAVGQAFEVARQTAGAPNLYAADHHHPSVAGTYLAALVFYRQFTGRTGAEATWRPSGLSAQDAATLVRLNGG